MFALVKILDLTAGNKVCFPVEEIRNLQVDDVHLNKKYKVWYEGCYRDCQILVIKESKQDVEELANKSRFAGVPKRNLVSTSEVTDEEVLKKKIKKDDHTMSTKSTLQSNLQQLKVKTVPPKPLQEKLQNDSEVLKQLIEFYKKKSTDLQNKNLIFEEKIQLLNSDYEEKVKENVQLQEENAELRNRIRETTEKYLDLCKKYSEFEIKPNDGIDANNVIKDLRNQLADKDVEIAQLKMMNEASTGAESRGSIIYKEGENKTTGHVEDNLMYMGFNWWIPKNVYDMAKHNVKTASGFVSNLSIAAFGIDVLKRSTITGNKSNRKSQHNAATPEKLDTGKVFAIRDCVRFWLQSETNLDKIEIEKIVDKTRFYIGRKISELKMAMLKYGASYPSNSSDPGKETANVPENEQKKKLVESISTASKKIDNSCDNFEQSSKENSKERYEVLSELELKVFGS